MPRKKHILSLTLYLNISFASPASSAEILDFLLKYDREFLGQASYSSVTFGETEITGFATHFSAGLFILSNLTVSGGYLSMTDATGATVLNGFDAALKCYALSYGSSTSLEFEGKRIVTRHSFTHYFLLGYKLRELPAEESVPQYSGFNYGYGANWFIGRLFKADYLRDVFINLEFDKARLSNPQGQTSQTSNYSLGLGLTF